MELKFLFSSHCLVMFYSCTKFHKIYKISLQYLEGFQSYLADTISIAKLSKEHNFIKNVVEVTVFVFCTLSDKAVHLYQVQRKCLKDFRDIERTRFSW